MRNHGSPSPIADPGRLDHWVRQVTLTAMVLVAVGLVLIGVALYAPRAHALSDISSRNSQNSREEAK